MSKQSLYSHAVISGILGEKLVKKEGVEKGKGQTGYVLHLERGRGEKKIAINFAIFVDI